MVSELIRYASVTVVLSSRQSPHFRTIFDMADSLPDSIGVSALERYDEFVRRLALDTFADTKALYKALTTDNNAGLSPVPVSAAFVDTMTHFASVENDSSEHVNSQTLAGVSKSFIRRTKGNYRRCCPCCHCPCNDGRWC